MKPTETEYAGCRFDFLTEAQWAAFFDAIGVMWLNPNKTFDLGPHGRFTPNLWLPSLSCWVAIAETEPSDKEARCLTAFAENLKGALLLLIVGPPAIGEHRITVHEPARSGSAGGTAECTYGEFTRCRRCDGICLRADSETHANLDDAESALGKHTCGDHDKWSVSGSLSEAYRAAQSLRCVLLPPVNVTRSPVQCCGRVVTTPFCPHCGKETIAPHPLAPLLHYLRTNAKKSTKMAHSAERNMLQPVHPGYTGKPYAEQARDAREAAVRWTNWADLLEGLITPNTQTGPGTR